MMRLRRSIMPPVLSKWLLTSWSISSPSSVRHPHMSGSLYLLSPTQPLPCLPLGRAAEQGVSRTKGVADALNQCAPDQGSARGASLPRDHTGQVLLGASGRGQPVERAAAGDDPGLGPLVSRRECVH